MNHSPQPPSACWFPREGTGSIIPSTNFLTATVLASALLIGTGGMMSREYFVRRSDMGYPIAGVASTLVSSQISPRTPAENVVFIRDSFKLSLTNMASLFNVSRQTVYDWLKDTRPSSRHQMGLQDLANAAEVFHSEGLSVSPYFLNRSITSGKNIFGLFREGVSAEEAARKLLETYRIEQAQRKALQARLANRKVPPSAYSQAGIPALDEES